MYKYRTREQVFSDPEMHKMMDLIIKVVIGEGGDGGCTVESSLDLTSDMADLFINTYESVYPGESGKLKREERENGKIISFSIGQESWVFTNKNYTNYFLTISFD